MTLQMQTSTIDWATANEEQLRNAKVPWPKSLSELTDIIESLKNRSHDYNTCVYAMSIAATAAFYYIANYLGVTGFQASCADLDVLRRTRGYEYGFQIIDYKDLLYPQYTDKLTITPESLLSDESVRSKIVEEAKKLLSERTEHAAPRVVRHWENLIEKYDGTCGE